LVEIGDIAYQNKVAICDVLFSTSCFKTVAVGACYKRPTLVGRDGRHLAILQA
jgi:hypothetical protein